MSSETNLNARPASAEPQFTLLQLANVLLAHRRLLVILPLVLVAFVVTRSLLSGRQYRTTSTLTPSAASSEGRLSGFAAQFGLSVGSAGSESVEFYRQLLLSRELLRQVAYTKYTIPAEPGSGDSIVTGTFVEIAGIEAGSPNQTTLQAITALSGLVSASNNYESNVITLTVQSDKPALSLQLHQRLLALADEYNVQRRRTQARTEREFVELRMNDARMELAAAEQSLENFLERNRQFAASPQLAFEHQRLQRRVDLRQQVYASLAQSYEQARIDEVRNTPVLSVITPPETVIEPVPRGTVRKGMLAGIIGLVFAVMLAFARSIFERKRAEATADYVTFIHLTRSVVSGALKVLPEPVRVRVRVRLPSLYAPHQTDGTPQVR